MQEHEQVAQYNNKMCTRDPFYYITYPKILTVTLTEKTRSFSTILCRDEHQGFYDVFFERGLLERGCLREYRPSHPEGPYLDKTEPAQDVKIINQEKYQLGRLEGEKMAECFLRCRE